jgi:enolase
MNNKTTTSVLVIIIATILSVSISVSAVQAKELNTNDFEYTLHITDIIPYYTYQGVSKVLSHGDQSFEDIDVFRFIIEDTNYYAVYNNNYDNTFVFAGIYEDDSS